MVNEHLTLRVRFLFEPPLHSMKHQIVGENKPKMRATLQILLLSVLVGVIVGINEAEVTEKASGSSEDDNTFAKMVLDVVVGTMLVIFTPVFLWFAETQVVKYETIVRRCQLATRQVKDTSVVRKGLNSRPVFVQGKTHVTKGAAVDSELAFAPSTTAARLERTVEMYQWIEDKSKDSNGNETVTYKKCWIELDIPSNAFRHSEQHRNPTRVPSLYSTVIDASQVQIGEYVLSSAQVHMLVDWQPSPVRSVPAALPRDLHAVSPAVESGYLVFNGNLAEPRVGTVRVSYRVVKSGGFVSTIGVQQGRSFRPFVEADAHRTTLSTTASSTNARVSNRPSASADEDLGLPSHMIGSWSESQDTNEMTESQFQQSRMKQAKLGTALTDLNAHPDSYSSHNNSRAMYDTGDETTPPPVENPHAPTCCESLECCACCCYCMFCQPGMQCLHALADWSVGSGILLLEEADVTVPDMFRHEWRRFAVRTWVIRCISYLLLGCGLYMMFFGPVVFLVSFIPYVGWFVGRVMFIAALIVGLLEGLLITTVASVFHRPILLAGTSIAMY